MQPLFGNFSRGEHALIGQRLKLARTAAGLSLRGLEERIGHRVTAQAVGKYERNESMPSSGVLIALPVLFRSRWITWSVTRKWSGSRRVSKKEDHEQA